MHGGRCDEVREATWGGEGAAAEGGKHLVELQDRAAGLGVGTVLSH